MELEVIIFCAIGFGVFGLWVLEKITHKNEENAVVTLRNFRVPEPIEAKKPDSHDTAKEIEEWAKNIVVSTPDAIVPVEMNSQFEEWEFNKVSPSKIKDESEGVINRLTEVFKSLTQEKRDESFERFRDELIQVLRHAEGIVSIRQTLESVDEALRPSFYNEAIVKLNKNQSMVNELCKGLVLALAVQAKETEDGGLYISNLETMELVANAATKTKRIESNLRSFITKRARDLLSSSAEKNAVTAIVPFTTPVTESFDAEFKVV